MPTTREHRAREAALHHAQLLQQRKDTEMEVLESLESLIDYPTSANADAAQRSIEDTAKIKELLIPFQPSDYDALIEERNINRKCGYVLCPNPNKLRGTKAKYGLLYTKGKGTRIVEQKDLERWCSSECGKRALYLRVQLSEDPAWERAGGLGGGIVLLEEKSSTFSSPDETSKITETLSKIDIRDGEEDMLAAMKDLAIERGDGNARANSTRAVDVHIFENEGLPNGYQAAPQLSEQASEAHQIVEGYQPRSSRLRTQSSEETSEAKGEDDLLSDLLNHAEHRMI